MRRYPEYKDSEVEWANALSPLPEGWHLVRLKYIAEITNSNVDKKTYEDGIPVRLCNYTDVYYREFITSDLDLMRATATEAEIERFSLRPGDVIITKDSEAWDDIAIPAVVTEELHGVVCGYHLAILRPRSGMVDGRFLFRALQSSGVREQFHVSAKGITRYGLSQHHIEDALIPVPPLGEQRRLADFLDRKTARIDTLIQKKQALIDLLREQRTALINRAVTRGLDPDVPMKDSGIEWLGSMPAHWEVKRVGYLCDMLTGFAFPSAEFGFDGESGGVPLVRGDNVTTGHLRWGARARYWSDVSPYERFLLADGDVVIGMDGSRVGNNYALITSADLPLLLVQRVMRLRPVHVSPALLYHNIGTSFFKDYVNTVKSDPAIPHISPKDIHDFKIAVPPPEEQRSLATYLEKATRRIGRLIRREQ
ncbi:MAG TPA: restriction endonuclease subunit S, partial [Longimicrobiaceae bacterium]|nr:restriction endonuclease subunit S [Longimicrobiaceae bacterium]